MTIGAIDRSLELQIADIVQRTLDDHYQGALTFGPIRAQEEGGFGGKRRLNIYIVCDGDYDLLYPWWDSGALLPEHLLPNLRPYGIEQDTNLCFVPKNDWKWFHKAQGLDF